MGQVTVNFLGVCTIFRNLPSLQRPPDLPPDTHVPLNRVVLAKVKQGSHPPIEPHIARLQLIAHRVDFDPGPPPHRVPHQRDKYDLLGVKLRLLNATGPRLSGCLCGLPGMQAHLDRPLGGPSRAVYVPDHKKVQAWFDLEHGEAGAFILRTEQHCDPRTQVPSITVVTVETDGDPVLEYQLFDGGDPIRITLHGGAEHPVPTVNVTNFADGKAFKDDPDDYYLNFELAEVQPPFDAVQIPKVNAPLPLSHPFHVDPPFECGDAGPGCSTTPFP